MKLSGRELWSGEKFYDSSRTVDLTTVYDSNIAFASSCALHLFQLLSFIVSLGFLGF